MESFFQKFNRVIKWLMGKVIDFDWKYANMCVDFVKKYAFEMGKPITTFGNAKDFVIKWLWPNWVRVKDISPGDIVIFTEWKYGHIAVIQKQILNNLAVVEQNRDGKAYAKNNSKNQWSPVSEWYYRITGKEVFFRPKP